MKERAALLLVAVFLLAAASRLVRSGSVAPSMPIQYRCDRCGIWLSISRKKIGEQIACPHCGAGKRIPPSDEPRPPALGAANPATTESQANPLAEIIFDEIPPQVSTAPPPALRDVAIPPSSTAPVEFSTWSEPAGTATPEGSASETPELTAADAPVRHRDGPAKTSRPPDSSPSEPPPARDRRVMSSEEDVESLALKRRPRDTEEMDLTPMVDMTFLLLIFFMITASLQLQKSLEMPAPNPDQSGAQQSLFTPEQLEQTSIRVAIDAENRVLVEEEPVAGPEQILERLKMQMRTTQRYELVVAADPAAFHETVVSVIDAAQAAGMEKIRMIGSTGDF